MALITRKPERALIAATRVGGLAAVELKQAGADRGEDVIDQRIVRIDQNRDRLDAA